MADGFLDLGADVVELAACPTPAAAAAPLRETAFRADAWTPEDVDALRRLFLADEDVRVIAESLGRTFHATRTKVCELGLRRNSARPWGEWEEAEILRRYGDDATAAIAQDLGRSCGAIYQRAAILGLTEGRPPPYTPWEDAQLRAGYAAGVPVAQIAALIGRPITGVLNRASEYLKIVHPNAPATWGREEIARAVELAGEGHTNRAIHAQLAAEGYPERTLLALKLMMTRLVAGRGWGRMWTAEEDELLRRAYAESANLRRLAVQIGRSHQSLAWRAEKLGIRGTHALKAGWLVDPVWTAEEDALLRTSYGKVRGKKLKALFPHRRGQAVYMRASALGLKAEYSKPASEDELRAIQIGYVVGLGLTDLALAIGRDVAVVHRLAKAMGLRFSDPQRPKPPKTPRAKRPPPPTFAEILAMPAAIPAGPFLPLLEGWRKRSSDRKAVA